MVKSVRTVRFDKKELERIEEFLKMNPFLDFSTLTRLSVQRFIENPNLQFTGLQNKTKKNS